MKGYYICKAKTNDSKGSIRAGMYYRAWAAPVYRSDDTAFLVETSEGDVHIGSAELFHKHFEVVNL